MQKHFVKVCDFAYSYLSEIEYRKSPMYLSLPGYFVYAFDASLSVDAPKFASACMLFQGKRIMRRRVKVKMQQKGE